MNSLLRASAVSSRGLRRALSVSATSPAGLSFTLSEDQRNIVDLARKFAKEEMIPKERYYDSTGEYPQPVFTKAWCVEAL